MFLAALQPPLPFTAWEHGKLGASTDGSNRAPTADTSSSWSCSSPYCDWWDTVASTAAIDCCSCRHHESSRRGFRRHAAPPS